MITILIILAEIGFWIFILAGLVTRYRLKKEKLSLWLFGMTPLIDLMLLMFTAFDLKNGAEATFAHGLEAIYIGVSIAYGKQMIQWADRQFQYYFLKIDNRPKKLYGLERGKKEMRDFFRHLLAFIIGGAFLGGMIYLSGKGSSNAKTLMGVWNKWSIILGIDFLISLSYILFPDSRKKGSNREAN